MMDSKSLSSLLLRANHILHRSIPEPAAAHASLRKEIESHLQCLEETRINLIGWRTRKNRANNLVASCLSRRGRHKTSLQAVMEIILALKSHYNSLAPISRLPTEILHHILSLWVRHCHDPFRMSIMGLIQSPLDTLAWIRMTHVCHAWREILIGDPNLWNQISASQSSWVVESLSRSRDMPLSVKVDFFDLHPDGEEAAMHALQQLPRIRELTLVIPNMGAVSEELINPAPILESFALQVYRRFTSPSLPEPLFAMIAPQLRRLSLENCQIPLNAPFFDKLTHLRLADSQLTLKFSEFLTILRRLGNLVDLSLLNLRLSEDFTEADLDRMAPVELPRLVKLVITEFPVSFLWNLRLPANPDVHLVFSYRRVLAVEQLEVAILSVLRCFTDLGVCTQALVIENTPSFWGVGHHPCDVPHEHPRFTVRLTHTLFSMVPRISRAFLAHPPIKDHLVVLKISGQRAAVVKQDMLPLKELRTLILDHLAAQEWLASMNRFKDPDIYPRLESIIFTEPVFSGDLGPRALVHFVTYITARIQSQCSSIKTLKLSAQELLGFTAASRLRDLVPEILFSTPE